MTYDPVEILKALSNPSRLEILKAIYRSGGRGTCQPVVENAEKCCCMGDMIDRFKLAPSTISHHTKELVRAGLVRVERDGQFVRLLPNPEALETLTELIGEIVGNIEVSDGIVDREGGSP
jgi:ArsR family transcriptional regulator